MDWHTAEEAAQTELTRTLLKLREHPEGAIPSSALHREVVDDEGVGLGRPRSPGSANTAPR